MRVLNSASPFASWAPLTALLSAGCGDMQMVATTSGVAVASVFVTPIVSKFLTQSLNFASSFRARRSGAEPKLFDDDKKSGTADPASEKVFFAGKDRTLLYKSAYHGLFIFTQLPAIYASLATNDPAFALASWAFTVAAPLAIVAGAERLAKKES